MAKKYNTEYDTEDKKPKEVFLWELQKQGVKTVMLQELNGNVIVVDDINHMSYDLMNCYVFDHTHNGSAGEEIPYFKKRWN